MKVSDTRILVSGGTRGIGRAMALELQRRGARVLVTGTRPSSCRKVANELGLEAVVCDVTEDEDVRALVDALQVRFGGLDVIIHSAGVQHEFDLVRGLDLADAERELEVNLLGPIRLTSAVMPMLLASPQAAVVNITSVLALAPKKRAPVYCASKAGLASWTDAIREQLRSRSVQVMELVPAIVATDMTGARGQGATSPEAVARVAVDGLERGRERVLVGKARLAYLMHRLAPRLLARMLCDS